MSREGRKHSNHEREASKNGAFDCIEGISNQRNDGKAGAVGVGG